MQLDDISVIKASIKWIMFIATNIFFKSNQPEMGFSKLKGTWI